MVPVVAVATSLVVDMEQSIASWVGFVAEQIGFGAAIGLTLGLGGITLLRRAQAAGWSDSRYEQIATFGLPVMAFTVAAASNGNGFIAAFAAELLAAVTFFVFGNLFVGDALGDFGPAVFASAIASLTIVRIIPVFVALTGSGCDRCSKLFIGWFGPRGMASIVFAILLLEQLDEMSERADDLASIHRSPEEVVVRVSA